MVFTCKGAARPTIARRAPLSAAGALPVRGRVFLVRDGVRCAVSRFHGRHRWNLRSNGPSDVLHYCTAELTIHNFAPYSFVAYRLAGLATGRAFVCEDGI